MSVPGAVATEDGVSTSSGSDRVLNDDMTRSLPLSVLTPLPTSRRAEPDLTFWARRSAGDGTFLFSNSVSFLHNRSCMSPRSRLASRILKTFLPIVLVIVVVFAAICVWLVRSITHPPRAAYLVTPESFSRVTGPMLQAQDVTWKNHDGTEARGWLIRGTQGAPAVILLHGYGADRSWLLNLAVKTNETTNFTVLWPDLRGHGENPPVNATTFGTVEGDDVTAAIDYLKTLKTTSGAPQVGPRIGLYGIELGAYAALDAARRYHEIRALALDSIPGSPDDLVRAALGSRTGMNNGVLQFLT